MLKKIGLLQVCGALFSASMAFLPTVVQAQLSILPMVVETEAQRGQAQGMIEVTNTGQKTQKMRIYAEPFTYNQETGIEIVDDNSGTNLTPYLRYSPPQLVIEPGQTRRIRFVTQFPPNSPSKEYRAVIFAENLERIAGGSNSGSIIPRIGVTVFVRNGDLKADLTVDNAEFDPQSRKIGLLIKNTGVASARTYIDWKLYQGETEIAKGLEPRWTILANNSRRVDVVLKPEMPQLSNGDYTLKGELLWGKQDNWDKLPFQVDFTVKE